jgi:6-pyruvoyltetrahydropterin/6-carboxytetrahydropterin synthase
MIIFRKFTFDSAHFLPNVSETHKCRNIHGHTYQLILFFSGDVDETLGWVMDFSDIKLKVNHILSEIDHKLLNDVKGLENPTCENVAIWLWRKIKMDIPILDKIELHETPSSGVIYTGV